MFVESTYSLRLYTVNCCISMRQFTFLSTYRPICPGLDLALKPGCHLTLIPFPSYTADLASRFSPVRLNEAALSVFSLPQPAHLQVSDFTQ